MATGLVFNIERFATEDGPGIRTVVFCKGCALRCRWCANPESQLFQPQVMLNANLCTGCGRCAALCPKRGIELREGYGFLTTSPECNCCGTCTEGCYQNARSIMGEEYTTQRLLTELLRDEAYYKASGGGVTFSGGEPCFYDALIAECAPLLRQHGATTLLETCGHVPPERFQRACMAADAVFFDVKHMNPEQHKALAGADNTLILENLRWLSANYRGQLSVRYPYISGCNTAPADVEAFLAFVSTLKVVQEVWFLPYHRLGLPKYQGLGRVYEMGDTAPLKMKDIAFLKDYAPKYGVNIRI